MIDEAAAIKALEAAGYIATDYRQSPGAANYQTRHDRYFVGAGSHGHAAPTVREAMIGCGFCCKIYLFWKTGRRPLHEVFEEIAVKHLGGSLHMHEWEPEIQHDPGRHSGWDEI